MSDELAARLRIAERLWDDLRAYRREHPNGAMNHALRSAAREAREGRDGEVKRLPESEIRMAMETWVQFNVEREIRVLSGREASDRAIAQGMGLTGRTIRRWRNTWGMAGLPDPVRPPRRGRVRTIGPPDAAAAPGAAHSEVVSAESEPATRAPAQAARGADERRGKMDAFGETPTSIDLTTALAIRLARLIGDLWKGDSDDPQGAPSQADVAPKAGYATTRGLEMALAKQPGLWKALTARRPDRPAT